MTNRKSTIVVTVTPQDVLGNRRNPLYAAIVRSAQALVASDTSRASAGWHVVTPRDVVAKLGGAIEGVSFSAGIMLFYRE